MCRRAKGLSRLATKFLNLGCTLGSLGALVPLLLKSQAHVNWIRVSGGGPRAQNFLKLPLKKSQFHRDRD